MFNYVIAQPSVQADSVQRLGAHLGSTFVDGSVHLRFGTRNFTAPLQNGQYIEFVCPLDPLTIEQTLQGKTVSKKAQESGGSVTWVFATEDASKVKEKFGHSVIEGQCARPDGSDLKWKQIVVNEVTNSRELPFFIQWLTADHLSQDRKAIAAIEKITIADTDRLRDSQFKSEILGGLTGETVDLIDPSTNGGKYKIVAVQLTTSQDLQSWTSSEWALLIAVIENSTYVPLKSQLHQTQSMIVGIGIDVIDIDRFKHSLDRTPGLELKLFTEAERTKSIQSLAARFAAKEALIKALSAGNGIVWHEVEVVNLEGGKPTFIFYGALAVLVNGANVHLSISHDAGIATAIVIVEQ